ncbi:aminoacyl-tRNA hydrolase [Candidatus Poribacteria bacterium]|nr:aminoacyl-tRNA hydrolase [Candidatus Poribacteria bacterium]
MKLIVGLGNPGSKYKSTRHNVGFEVLDLFCREVCTDEVKHRFFSSVANGKYKGEELILAKPQTFMNSSGTAVNALKYKYGISPEDIFVIYDDFNLDLGMLRIRLSGSSGGHKGMKSIIESIGSKDFPRLRIGIGSPPHGMDVMKYVLGRFSPDERATIEESKLMALKALKVMIHEGIEPAMTRFNGRRD